MSRKIRANALRQQLFDVNGFVDDYCYAVHCGRWLAGSARNVSLLQEKLIEADVDLKDLFPEDFHTCLQSMLVLLRPKDDDDDDAFLRAFALLIEPPGEHLVVMAFTDNDEPVVASIQMLMVVQAVTWRHFSVAGALLHGSARHRIPPLDHAGSDAGLVRSLLTEALFYHPYCRRPPDERMTREFFCRHRTNEAFEFVWNELRNALPDAYVTPESLFPITSWNDVLDRIWTCFLAYLRRAGGDGAKEMISTDRFIALLCMTDQNR